MTAQSSSRAIAGLVLPLLAVGLAGCASLLPRGSSEQPSAFDSFEAAQRALEQVVPFRGPNWRRWASTPRAGATSRACHIRR